MEVLTATNGEAGLERCFDAEPDIVPLDVVMPRMSGVEVLKAIRQVSDLPVIILTATSASGRSWSRQDDGAGRRWLYARQTSTSTSVSSGAFVPWFAHRTGSTSSHPRRLAADGWSRCQSRP